MKIIPIRKTEEVRISYWRNRFGRLDKGIPFRKTSFTKEVRIGELEGNCQGRLDKGNT